MKAGLTRRLERVEDNIAARFGDGAYGRVETHFVGGWSESDRLDDIQPCEEHGPTCLVRITPLTCGKVTRIIVHYAEPGISE